MNITESFTIHGKDSWNPERNRFEGPEKRVLCVCTAGLLRSPTIAKVLSEEWGFNTRSAGIHPDFALILVSERLLNWAEEIVTVNPSTHFLLENVVKGQRTIHLCDLEDRFERGQPELVKLIRRWATDTWGPPGTES